jgi:hypothetical protein
MAAAATILGTINLGLGLATVLIPEGVKLYEAIKGLIAAHPALTDAQVLELVASISADIKTTNAATTAVLAGIDPSKPPPATP